MTNLVLSLGTGASLFYGIVGGIEADYIKVGFAILSFFAVILFKSGMTLMELRKDVGYIKINVDKLQRSFDNLPCKEYRKENCSENEGEF